MARVCTTVTEWIQTEISKPVEDWVERQDKKCKKRPWYHPLRWLCWFVITLVRVIRWIVITVVTAVITLVCRVISEVLSAVWSLLKFLGQLIIALVTWDKCALQEAIGNLSDAVVGVLQLIGVAVIRPIIDRVQTYRLRRYVKDEIEKRYTAEPDVVARLCQRFNVDTGVFGYRVTCTSHRMFVDSKTVTGRFGAEPDLFAMHDQGLINLFELAGFEAGCALLSRSGWYRPRHQTAMFPFASGDGIGEPIPPRLKREQLKEYINSRGTKGPHFRIYALTPGHLSTRIDTAEEWGRQLGLVLSFDRKDLEVTDEKSINYTHAVQTDFLIQKLNRQDKNVNPDGARMDLCAPVAVGVFGFTDRTTRGLASNPIGTNWCIPGRNLHTDDTSGVSFIDDLPDSVRKYVLIHELGHYYGLCHVDGFARIMVSGKSDQGKIFTWCSIPNSLIHGGPRFIYAEAKRTWDFIIANFPHECLAPGTIGPSPARHQPPAEEKGDRVTVR